MAIATIDGSDIAGEVKRFAKLLLCLPLHLGFLSLFQHNEM